MRAPRFEGVGVQVARRDAGSAGREAPPRIDRATPRDSCSEGARGSEDEGPRVVAPAPSTQDRAPHRGARRSAAQCPLRPEGARASAAPDGSARSADRLLGNNADFAPPPCKYSTSTNLCVWVQKFCKTAILCPSSSDVCVRSGETICELRTQTPPDVMSLRESLAVIIGPLARISSRSEERASFLRRARKLTNSTAIHSGCIGAAGNHVTALEGVVA